MTGTQAARFRDTARRVLTSPDYLLIGKGIHIMPYINVPGQIVFYFTCLFQGYWENLPLRLLAAGVSIPLIFYPRDGRLGRGQRLYYEAVTIFILPFFFMWFFLQNGLNTYWFVSFVWAGLIYGAVAGRAWSSLVLFPLASLAAVFIHGSVYGAGASIAAKLVGGFSIAWLTSIVMAFMRFAADVYYLMSIDLESAQIRMAEAEKSRDLLEKKNAELVARNATISTFVRPSVLDEVNRGEDPRLFSPRIVEKAIMICDMRNFTPLTSSMKKADEQAAFINRYYELMIEPVFRNGGEVDKLMGDAIMAIFPDGKRAVEAALRMRRHLQESNQEKYADGQDKIRNVFTLAKGVILEANIGARLKLDRTWIGPAVNIAARMESIAKYYGLEILVTEEVMADMPGYPDARLVDIIKVKGYHRKFEVFEVYGHQAAEVVAVKNATRELLHAAIRLYFTEGRMAEAAMRFRDLLGSIPPHRFNSDRFMDSIVSYYIGRCAQWLEHDDKTHLGLDLGEGCHDFSSYGMRSDWQEISRESVLGRSP